MKARFQLILSVAEESDPIWGKFEKISSDPDRRRCKTCPRQIKVRNGDKWTKCGLVKHLMLHKRKRENLDKDTLKAWLVGCMVTVLNIPCQVFNSVIFRILFWLTSLGPVSAATARGLCDNEAE